MAARDIGWDYEQKIRDLEQKVAAQKADLSPAQSKLDLINQQIDWLKTPNILTPFGAVVGAASGKQGPGGISFDTDEDRSQKMWELANEKSKLEKQIREKTPQYSALESQLEPLRKEAKFEFGAKTQMGREQTQAAEDYRRQLAESLAGTKRSAQQRGLLHSGLRQADEASAFNQMAAQQAQAAAKAQASYRDKMAQYRGEQVNRGLDEYQLAQQRAASDYNAALQKRRLAQQQQSSAQSTGAAVGGVLGGIAGGVL